MKQVSFATFVGQESIKRDLEVRISAAKMRQEPLDHFLFCGSDQMGKLTLAKTIAPEMNSNLRILDVTLDRPSDLAALLAHLKPLDILLIEDVELLRKSLIPVLAEAAQNFTINIVIGRGVDAKNMRLNLPHFTIIGTSSRPSQIDRQIRQIFGPRYDFVAYTIAEMSQLVTNFAVQHNQTIQRDAADLVARFCEGIPGNAKILIKRIADFCLVKAPSSSITLNLAKAALTHLGYSSKSETPSELAQRLNSMDGIEFEQLTAQLFHSRGYTIELTKRSGDHGIDIFARKGQEFIGIQCKRWTSPVGEPVIRDFYGALLNSGAKFGVVIATSGFTAHAIDFAQEKPIRLVDLDKLIELILSTR